jgi:hypothetical protein
MFKVTRMLTMNSHWLIVSAFLVLGIVAWVASPSPFEQKVYASEIACGPENPCPAGMFCYQGYCVANCE